MEITISGNPEEIADLFTRARARQEAAWAAEGRVAAALSRAAARVAAEDEEERQTPTNAGDEGYW